jgi:hypothetical protein
VSASVLEANATAAATISAREEDDGDDDDGSDDSVWARRGARVIRGADEDAGIA